jgi:hypothetical protein
MQLTESKIYTLEFPNGTKGRAIYQGFINIGNLVSHNFESLSGEEIFSPHENRHLLGKSDRWFPLPEMLLYSVKITPADESQVDDDQDSKKQRLLDQIIKVENITVDDIKNRYDVIKMHSDRLMSLFNECRKPPELKERTISAVESYLSNTKIALNDLKEEV